MNHPPQRRANLALRARVLAAVRRHFTAGGYLEVETPVRIPAPIPEAHIDPQPSGRRYLHTSPELCMKRLLAAGYDRIFQICRCFRRGERGRRHLPEFSLLEWYRAGSDYRGLMADCEALFAGLMRDLRRDDRLTFQGISVDLSPPCERLTVAEAFDRHADVTPARALARGRFDEVLALEVEPHLGIRRPVFLVDYPAECGALARPCPGDPARVERFELYVAGMELCNGFSELTDPEEQRRRFAAERAQRLAAGREAAPMPERFLADLERMPAAAGNALGLDRLVMLLADADRIDAVSAFTPEEL